MKSIRLILNSSTLRGKFVENSGSWNLAKTRAEQQTNIRGIFEVESGKVLSIGLQKIFPTSIYPLQSNKQNLRKSQNTNGLFGVWIPNHIIDNPHYFLGFQIIWTRIGLTRSQSSYIIDILAQSNMLESKPISTSTDLATCLCRDGEPFSDPTLYRCTVGSL